jgi:hypothetical protein
MSGLINSANIANPLLKQAEQYIENNLKPELRNDYMKIVIAGLKVGLDKGKDSILASLHQSRDPITDCVKGAIGVIGLLKRRAKGTMPVKAMIPAAATLMLQALDYADKAGIVTVGKDELDQATQLFTETILPFVGVSHDQMAKLTQQVHGIMGDPAKMAALKKVPLTSNGQPQASGAPPPGGQNGL